MENLNKIDIAKKKTTNIEKMHGFVTPEGHYVSIPTNAVHETEFRKLFGKELKDAYKEGYSSLGHGGEASVVAHKDHITNTNSPMMRSLRRIIGTNLPDQHFVLAAVDDNGTDAIAFPKASANRFSKEGSPGDIGIPHTIERRDVAQSDDETQDMPGKSPKLMLERRKEAVPVAVDRRKGAMQTLREELESTPDPEIAAQKDKLAASEESTDDLFKGITNNWSYNPKTFNINHPEHGSMMMRQSMGNYHVLHNGKNVGIFKDKESAINHMKNYMVGLSTNTVPIRTNVNMAKSEILEKKVFNNTKMSGDYKHLTNSFHGVISPEGVYYHMPKDMEHSKMLRHIMASDERIPSHQIYKDAAKQGYITLGNGGDLNVGAHDEHIKNLEHPATKTLMTMIKKHIDPKNDKLYVDVGDTGYKLNSPADYNNFFTGKLASKKPDPEDM